MARLPLTVNLRKLFWAERLKSRRQRTGHLLLAQSPAAGFSRFQRDPWLSQHRPIACQSPSSAQSRFPRASPPSRRQPISRGQELCLPSPSLLWVRVCRKATEEGCWSSQCSPAPSQKPLPSHPPAAAFSCHCPLAIGCNVQRRDWGIFLLSWVNMKSVPL